MDLELLKGCLVYTKKKKKSVFLLGLLGLTCYTTYRVSTLPSVVTKRQRLCKLFGALVSVAEMVSESAEAIGVVSRDVKEFIQSDSDQIPQSLKQVSKIASSNEFSKSLSEVTRALTVGVLRGYNREVVIKSGGSGRGGEARFSDRVMDKLFTDRGSDFASVVVGSLTRNVVVALYSADMDMDTDKDRKCGKGSDRNGPSWIEVFCQDENREVIGDWIRSFVTTAVTVYLDKTMDINTYDEIFAGVTNPKHEPKIRDMLVNVCNAAVETYIRTSQRVGAASSDGILSSTYSKFDFNGKSKLISASLHGKNLVKNQDGGWANKVSSTLAVPSNRKLILDMTGMLTVETMRSFLEFLFDKLAERAKRSVDVVNRELVERGVEAMRYVSCRSSAVATICLSLCLHMLNGPWILAPTGFER